MVKGKEQREEKPNLVPGPILTLNIASENVLWKSICHLWNPLRLCGMTGIGGMTIGIISTISSPATFASNRIRSEETMLAGSGRSRPGPHADDRSDGRKAASGDAQARFDVGPNGYLCCCVCQQLVCEAIQVSKRRY